MTDTDDVLLAASIAPGARVLVIQSGQPHLAYRIVERLREVVPSAEIALLVRRDVVATVPSWNGVEVIRNEGPKPAFVRALRARAFDHVIFLVTGEPGYWKLQTLAFVLAPRRFAVDENLAWFPVTLSGRAGALRHVRRRLDHSIGPTALAIPRVIARAAMYPVAVGRLLLYERRRSAVARARGAPEWKRQNRPDRW
jgi:hypothetical protein